MPSPARDDRRTALCIGVGEFIANDDDGNEIESGYDYLPNAGKAAAQLAEALAGAHYTTPAVTQPGELSAANIGRLVHATIDSAGPDGIAVVHVLSQGEKAPT